MFQELSDILVNRVSPEVMAGVSSLAAALQKHDAVLWRDQIVNLKMEANVHDQLTLSDRAIGIIYTQVSALLQQMNIGLDLERLRMDILADILDALHFKPSDFDEDIKAIIEAGEDSIEIFTDILALLTNRIPEELMEYVLDVPMDVIIVINETVQRNIENTQSAKEGLKEIVQVLNKHQNLVGTATTVGLEALQDGKLYDDPMTLIGENKERLLSGKPDAVADDLISIALHTNVSNEALQDEVMFYVENLHDDIFSTQQIFKHVKTRVKQLSE